MVIRAFVRLETPVQIVSFASANCVMLVDAGCVASHAAIVVGFTLAGL